MKIYEIVEMRYVGRVPTINTVGRPNSITKKLIKKQTDWYNNFQQVNDQEKFKLACEKSKNSYDKVEITLLDQNAGIKDIITDNKIESFDPTTGDIIFLKKSNKIKEMVRMIANINDAVYKGRVRSTTSSPFKYMFEIPFDSTKTKSEPNLDFKSVSTRGPRRAFHQF